MEILCLAGRSCSVVLVVSLQPTHPHQIRNPTYRSISPRVPNSNLYNTTPVRKPDLTGQKLQVPLPSEAKQETRKDRTPTSCRDGTLT